MDTFQLLALALSSVRRNALRSILTILGIVIGVAAVIALVSFGQSYQNYVESQFQGIGASTLFVGSTNPSGRNANLIKRKPLTMDDYQAIADPQNVPDAVAVAPVMNTNATLVANSQSMSLGVTGTIPDYAVARSQQVSSGRFITASDLTTGSMVAVIGTGVVQQLFPSGAALGELMRINNQSFTVIGILQSNSGGGGAGDRVVIVPITTFQQRLAPADDRTASGDYQLSQILVQTSGPDAVNQAKIDIGAVLFKQHQIQYVGEEDYNIFSQSTILDTLESVLSIVTLFLGMIAGISLLVGGIGVMNIMMVSVTERTREIGLRKAVGAKYGNLLLQFLFESVTLCLIGGFLGVALGGVVTVIGSNFLPTLRLSISVPAIILSVAVSTAIGVFFGLYPANRAALMKPIEALRYE
jgi:putative ABC transport system permease protein